MATPQSPSESEERPPKKDVAEGELISKNRGPPKGKYPDRDTIFGDQIFARSSPLSLFAGKRKVATRLEFGQADSRGDYIVISDSEDEGDKAPKKAPRKKRRLSKKKKRGRK